MLGDDELSDTSADAHLSAGGPTTDSTVLSAEPLGNHEPVEQRPRRSVLGLMMIILIILMLVIIAWLLRQCGGQIAGSDARGDKVIESLDDATPVAGTLSVWISGSTTIERALSGARIAPTTVTNLGDGRFVIEVGSGETRGAAQRLKTQPGVNDVGLVYEPLDETVDSP